MFCLRSAHPSLPVAGGLFLPFTLVFSLPVLSSSVSLRYAGVPGGSSFASIPGESRRFAARELDRRLLCSVSVRLSAFQSFVVPTEWCGGAWSLPVLGVSSLGVLDVQCSVGAGWCIHNGAFVELVGFVVCRLWPFLDLACASASWSPAISRLWLGLGPCSWCCFLVLLQSRLSSLALVVVPVAENSPRVISGVCFFGCASSSSSIFRFVPVSSSALEPSARAFVCSGGCVLPASVVVPECLAWRNLVSGMFVEYDLLDSRFGQSYDKRDRLVEDGGSP
ncbi:hypothetical protein F2Q68_00019505 [Brassica cretica]|uniref:Uncharacterized protein n=1 Tax=Brassica cretica TaxID=69181 RepID=A0A8S9FSS9_BRACR|nr:hypothetical protein F2Q68_00019505 [Brassica cretica]